MAPAACGHAVSGAVSLPSRGAFHLSLTVLVHYRSQAVFSLGGWSPQLRAAFHVCGPTREPGSAHPHVSPTGLVPLFGRPFQAVRLHGMVTARTCEHPGCPAPRPPGGNASPLMHSPGFGLGALSLAATRAISVDFSSSAYLDVSVRRVVLRTLMVLGCGYPGMTLGGFPHSETSGCKRVCAPRRRLSQLAASFIDCLCQGIHRAPVISSMLTPFRLQGATPAGLRAYLVHSLTCEQKKVQRSFDSCDAISLASLEKTKTM